MTNNLIVTPGNFIGGGLSNKIQTPQFTDGVNSFGGSVIVGGRDNTISPYCHSGNFIGGGCGNSITTDLSGIVGGASNSVVNTLSFVVGNGITTNRDLTTFVNNLSIVDIPSSSKGLPPGSVYVDGGFLKIVLDVNDKGGVSFPVDNGSGSPPPPVNLGG